MNKSGVSIDCEHCKFDSVGRNNDFLVSVPVRSDVEEQTKIAMINCEITPYRHQINLVQLTTSFGTPVEIDSNTQQNLTKVLELVGNKKVCGNKNVCPKEVVKLVHSIEEDFFTK